MDAVKPTAHPEVNAVLETLLARVQATLGTQFYGLALYGSLASGDFDPERSDIDFVVLTHDCLAEEQMAALQKMHIELNASEMKWAARLEGAYLPVSVLRRHDPSAPPCLQVNEQSFTVGRLGSEWILQRHILREHGLVLAGPLLKPLIDPVSPDELRQAVWAVLQEWWRPMLRQADRLQRRDYQVYAVLTMCRALYTLWEGSLISKPAAALWAQQTVGAPWVALIAEALAWPQGEQVDRFYETLRWIEYVLLSPAAPANLIAGPALNLDAVSLLQEKPIPFMPGEALFWDDEHISKQMLAAHLDAETEAASRRPETIDRTVEWLAAELKLPVGAAVLDLGCGPGLYASRLARKGLRVTGVDYSRRSIEYAAAYARAQRLEIVYRYENYLALRDENCYDAALLIYGDFCPLNPQQRAMLLRNVRRALKPGGCFILDVTTRPHRRLHSSRNAWRMLPEGFWKPTPHLLLEEGFDYPEQSIWLNQAVVVETNGKVSVYRMWFQDYTPATIAAELARGGFEVESVWGDLTGQPYQENSEWIGIVARKGARPL